MSISANVLERELLAQKKRIEAIEYLNKQGQNVESDKDKMNTPKLQTDNTLDLLFRQKAISILKVSQNVEKSSKEFILKQQEELRKSKEQDIGSQLQLPPSWEKVLDPNSNLYYYWNTKTSETTWEKPFCTSVPISNQINGTDTDTAGGKLLNGEQSNEVIPIGWKKVIHPATKQVYYVNELTGEKKSSFESNDQNKAAVNKGDDANIVGEKKKSSSNSKQDIEKRRRIVVDPLDPTGGMGKWMDGLSGDGKMADSTASGPLWQQRPYPAPGSILRTQQSQSTAAGAKGGSVGPVGPTTIRK